ncbi:hypothetical protein B296_00057825 [Ensete ventricosum]|uniref:Uncharacterized protein n=1 Tax=Ensete ventricosum TaxID=4639 RepID=A0A426WXM1_ENSVE|nr:hypothetical protein B296_00057825 [Ensete ventricosum]
MGPSSHHPSHLWGFGSVVRRRRPGYLNKSSALRDPSTRTTAVSIVYIVVCRCRDPNAGKKAIATEVGRRRIPLAVGTFSVKQQRHRSPISIADLCVPLCSSDLLEGVFYQRWEQKGQPFWFILPSSTATNEAGSICSTSHRPLRPHTTPFGFVRTEHLMRIINDAIAGTLRSETSASA